MHDTELEERLRAVLRDEADRLPMRVDVERVEAALALRRRSHGRARAGLLAAGVGLAAFGLAAIGLGGFGPRVGTEPTAPPASTSAGPVASPTAAASTISGLEAIESQPGSRVLLDVPPTVASRAAHHTVTNDDPRASITRVSVVCLDREATSDGEPHLVSVTSGGTTLNAVCVTDQPFATQYPLGDVAAPVEIDVPPGVAYTVLVEAVPAPAELPDLQLSGTLVDEEPVPEPEIDEASAWTAPRWDDPATTQAFVIGTLDEGFAQQHAMACLGPGQLQVELRPAGAALSEPPLSGSGVDCIGEPQLFEMATGLEGRLDVAVRIDSRAAWHVLSISHGELPVFTPPELRMTSTLNGQAHDDVGRSGEVGCGLGYDLGDGVNGADACGPPEWSDVTDVGSVLAAAGGDLHVAIAPPWTFSAVVAVAPADQVGREQPPTAIRDLAAVREADGSLRIPVTFGPGDWVVRVTVSGERGDDRFGVPYFFLVRVD